LHVQTGAPAGCHEQRVDANVTRVVVVVYCHTPASDGARVAQFKPPLVHLDEDEAYRARLGSRAVADQLPR
jgi:hypothetical protein